MYTVLAERPEDLVTLVRHRFRWKGSITLCPQCKRENGVKLTKLMRCLYWESFECDHEYFDFMKEKPFFFTCCATDKKCLKGSALHRISKSNDRNPSCRPVTL